MSTSIAADEVRLAVFLGPIGLSHRKRDDDERRFQNPGQGRPILIPEGTVPLLVGVWSSDEAGELPEPVLSVADVHRRAGRETRFSVFTPFDTLRQALDCGWAETRSDTGERLVCFRLSELSEFLSRHVPAELGLERDKTEIAGALRRELGRSGLTENEALEYLRRCRVLSKAAEATGLAEGVLQAIYEQRGRPFLLTRPALPTTLQEVTQSILFMQRAAEELDVTSLTASAYDRFARNQNLTIELWPRSAAMKGMHGGWAEACEAAGLDGTSRAVERRYPAQRCREFIDRYVTDRVEKQLEPSRSGYLLWRAENGGPSISQLEVGLGPMDDQIRSALNRVDI